MLNDPNENQRLVTNDGVSGYRGLDETKDPVQISGVLQIIECPDTGFRIKLRIRIQIRGLLKMIECRIRFLE